MAGLGGFVSELVRVKVSAHICVSVCMQCQLFPYVCLVVCVN